MIYAVIAIIIILLFLFCYYQNNKLDITEYNLNSDNLNKPITIVHLSDFHSKPFNAVLKKVSEIKPDYICITGDYINDRAKNKEKMIDFGKKLVQVAPVVYITGNHERRLDFFEKLMEELKGIGFNVLLNEAVTIGEVTFLGLDENQADFEDYKARKNGTFEYRDMCPYFSLIEGSEKYKVVLSHFPENFEEIKQMNYSKYNFDLQLSGHAHGGQWIMPFIGPLYSPGQGVFPKYARGSFGDRPKLIISRGLGNAEFPLRLFNHPEINVINISSVKKP
ncbi:MAG: metallophosphoesterase [Eubacterium sp.]